ncbi:hypothetical protein QBC33DRAFT_520174 [Phialemonium atrogriseum]|uniref:Uncharacterized protein n=1 Tax=Phialemonium atrogriseum TaxID=1093897 RepID=A0AAJ0BTG0_9PEZI|nr:uncharacterized protein QBC33DRAFT_520174 [Phialemonium atrogriseum]KAK1761721.1 hypothetical protein QBC33DRAFT_520174 [Phialemonium atrogriseum]
MGLVAGHLIECGNYVTGGNFCGFKRIQPYYNLSYPIAEIFNDRHCIATKQPGQNGPSTSTLFGEGPDRVSVSGFKGLSPPQTLKVAIQAYAGYQAEILVYAIGLDIQEKARSFETQLRRDLASKELHKLDVQILGGCAPDPGSSDAATAVIRVFAQAAKEETLTKRNFEYPLIQNLGQAFPGFTPNLEYARTGQPRPYLAYFPALIDRSKVDMKVHWVGSQDCIAVSHSIGTTSGPNEVVQENYEPTNPVGLDAFGPTVRVPLGHKVFARSGDKAANVNIGFFPQGESQEEWDWLRSFLTTQRLIELLGDDARTVSRIERTEFPRIKGVHFVLFDLLGGGVTDTSRPDSLGKGLAEFVRARIVDYPVNLYSLPTI